jgi:hypothetical protein
MLYGILVWGNSVDSKKVFTMQKRIVRITAGIKKRVCCRELFKKFNIK